MRVRTLPTGHREIIERGTLYKKADICILIIASQDIGFADLVDCVNSELPVMIEAKVIAEKCLRLQEKGLIKVYP